MRTHSVDGLRRTWRAACLAVSGAAVLLTVGAFGVLGAGPAQAGTSQAPLIPVFVVQPTTTQVYEAVRPPVVVAVKTVNGQLDWNYNGPVILKYAVDPDGAPEPIGNVAYAWHGIAKFYWLAFRAVGFGFELDAVLPGPPPVPWLPGWNWNWGPGFGWPPHASAPFDVVDQLLQCTAEQTCQSETVSSDGTSGASAANTAEGGGTLASTGGGFGSLSCTTAGGVVSFSSNLPQTITVTLAGYLAGHRWLKSFNICWGAAEPFVTKSGATSAFNPANNEYEGLLPNCSPYGSGSGPCVLSRSRTWWGPVTSTVLAPAGDPHITY